MKAVLLILLAATSLTFAAEPTNDDSYFARSWTAEDGLPENNVVGLAQTPDGYLWVATLGGLVHFDGVRFQTFEGASSAGFGSSTMRVLQLDRDGHLWVGKEGATICIEGMQVRAWTAKDGFPEFEGQRSIADDSEGAVWVSYARAIFRLKDGHVEDFTSHVKSLPSGVCWLVNDRNGRLWFAKGRQVGVYRDGVFTVLRSYATSAVRIAPARTGGVWVCAGQEVSKVGEQGEPVVLGEMSSASEPTALLEDRDGTVWVGTGSDGLFRCESNRVTHVETTYPVISSLAEDREGDLWVGTRGGGLNRVQRRVVSLVDTRAGLPFAGVQSVCQDASGTVWAIGQNEMLARFQNGQWTLAAGDIPPGIRITCVTADPHGAVFVGTRGGSVYRWQGGEFKNLNLRESLHGLVRSLFVTKSGDLWIGSDTSSVSNALHRWCAGTLQNFDLPPGHRYIRAMAEDVAGNFWAGGSDGLLVRVTGDTLVDETSRFSKFSIRCLYGDPDGSLWMGYARYGVGRLRDGKFTRFAAEQGLPNDYVSQILSDGHGGMWFAGNQGVFQVREREFDDIAAGRSTRVQPVIYGRSEGMPNLQANFDFCPNSVRSGDDRLYFSMLTGLSEVQASRTRQNRLPPVVFVERVQADGRTYAAYEGSGASTNVPPPMELRDAGDKAILRLPPGSQRLRIEFTALSLVAPENVQFRYKLEGLDQGWLDGGTQRFVEYTHLPPGDYHFKVVACNNDGLWNENGASLAITLEPHLWETLSFKVLAGAMIFTAVCGTIVLALRRRDRLQIQRLEQQRTVERERTRIARDLHDDLGAGLTEIGLLGDLAGTPAASPDASREYVQEITGRARQMVGMLDEIVWAINPANDTAQSLSDYFSRYAQTLLERANIRCRLEVAEPLPGGGLNAEERHQLFLAFKEALNNVIRHSRASEVRISLDEVNAHLRIRIADNGHGFQTPRGEGSHNGLTGMDERLRRLGGRCEIVSAAESGTTVTLSMPILAQKKL